MISFVHGRLCEIEENAIVVEAGGIGYGIRVPATVLPQLPSVGEEVRIYTYFSVREDGQSLYGFLFREDREMFRQLITVSGIGPKGALGILSVLRPDDLRLAVMTGDAKSISRAPGIGPKTAQRVILELKDKIDAAGVLGQGLGVDASELGGAAAGGLSEHGGPVLEAIDALTALGYSRVEAGRAVRKLQLTEEMSAGEILKLALRSFQ